MRTSSTRHPGASGRWVLGNTRALENTLTLNPTDVMSRRSASRIEVSSSTTKTKCPPRQARARRGTRPMVSGLGFRTKTLHHPPGQEYRGRDDGDGQDNVLDLAQHVTQRL